MDGLTHTEERVIRQLIRWGRVVDFLGLVWALRRPREEVEPAVRDLERRGLLTWHRGLVRLADEVVL